MDKCLQAIGQLNSTISIFQSTSDNWATSSDFSWHPIQVSRRLVCHDGFELEIKEITTLFNVKQISLLDVKHKQMNSLNDWKELGIIQSSSTPRKIPT